MSQEWITSQQAAARLGVKPATVYAYVSRGQLRSRRAADGRRTEIPLADVEALTRRPARPSAEVKDTATVRTAITALTRSGPAYRGHLAVELAGRASFEQVAELLWTATMPADTPTWESDPTVSVVVARALAVLPAHLLSIERLRVAVAVAAAADDLRGELGTDAVLAAGRSLIVTMAHAVMPSVSGGPTPGGDRQRGGVAALLAASLAPDDAPPWLPEAIGVAMVLLADHEMAVSAVAARVAASAQADPYAVVAAGLAAGSGARHAGASLPVEGWMQRWVDSDGRELPPLRGGQSAGGFGHAVYVDGDARGERLLEWLADRVSGEAAQRLALIERLRHRLVRRGLPAPNVDFALAALTVTAGLPAGAGEAIFVIARTAGWLAHALEEYADGQIVRPRALYTGPPVAAPPIGGRDGGAVQSDPSGPGPATTTSAPRANRASTTSLP